MVHTSHNLGPLFALISAFLFGISPPLAKMVIGTLSPLLLAGLLYLGSGIGLLIIYLFKRQNIIVELRTLKPSKILKLIIAT